MKDKKNFMRKIGDFLAGKGFYVVLFICTAVIGISAWILLTTGNNLVDPAIDTIAESPQTSQEAMVPSSNIDVTPPATDTLEKPSASPKPTASAKPSETPKPSAAPSANKPDSNAAAAMAKDLTFVWPVVGDIAVVYSVDELIYNETMSDWRTHDGIDISSLIGTKVMAAADGTVVDVFEDDLIGTTVIIDHGNGLQSIYANLAGTPVVKKDDKVAMGAVIGAVGDTALGETCQVAHLHFAMVKDDVPVDPLKYLPNK